MEPFPSRTFETQSTQLFYENVKVYCIERLGEIQEEHSTSTTIVNLPIHVIEKAGKTSVRGVPLPESRLGAR